MPRRVQKAQLILKRQNAKIRVDASSQIGLGHLIRCVSLAHMIKDTFSVCFYMIDPSSSIQSILKKENLPFINIEEEDNYLNDLKSDDVAILDGYSFDLTYQKNVRKTGCYLICIDDLHDQHFVADLIINHAPGITKEDYSREDYTFLALGPVFALLRPEFLNQMVSRGEREGVFVCLGGADPLNLTQKVLLSLFNINPQINVNVVLGAGNKRQESILTWAKSSEFNLMVYQSLSAEEMAQVMRKSKHAIVPSSGILMETLATGLTPLIGYFVDNQMEMYKAWKALGLFTLGDMRVQANLEKNLSLFNFNQQEYKSDIANLIDGNSGKRLLSIIQDGLSKG